MKIKQKLLEKAQSLPSTPGCYLMKNAHGEIIYVGKAKKLKARVSTYFNNSKKFIKTQALVSHIREFDFLLTSNEVESLVLENNLIKEHSPKYNIRLKDDKTYPYIQINYNEKFPRLEYTRKPKRKKNVHVFGPFPESFQMKKILQTLTKFFKLRDCSLHDFNSRKNPCMLFDMHQCGAPCVLDISSDLYHEDLKKVENFFMQKNFYKTLVQEINEKMLWASKSEEFEKAAILRDTIQDIEKYQENIKTQKVELGKAQQNIDIHGVYFGQDEIDISTYLIRNSLLIGINNISLINSYSQFKEFQEDLPSILLSYYSDKKECPQRIVVELDSNQEDVLSQSLLTIFEQKVQVGQSKQFENLFSMSKKHAENSQRMRYENSDGIFKALNKLKSLLNLDELPRVLECYDVAIFQGSSPTASQIVFIDGKPEKSRYRQYKLQVRNEGNNDFAMMQEVLSRRIKSGNLPDLFIVDGGKGQVSVFLEVLKESNIDIPVIGIAKAKIVQQARFQDKEIVKTDERLIIPGRLNPFILSKSPELFRQIVKMRNEAHRFSRKLHHKLEESSLIHSELSKIPGIGPKTVKKILRKLNSPIEELAKLPAKDLSLFFGIRLSSAQSIIDYFQPQKN